VLVYGMGDDNVTSENKKRRPRTVFNSETAKAAAKLSPMHKPGWKTKATIFRTNAELLAKQSGITPLEMYLGMMNDEQLPLEMRKMAADSAAPFLHRKLAADNPPPPSVPTTAQVVVYIPGNSRDAKSIAESAE
jgi:hypothetical protein